MTDRLLEHGDDPAVGAGFVVICAELELRGLITTGTPELDPDGWDDPEKRVAILVPMELTERGRAIIRDGAPADEWELGLLAALQRMTTPDGYTHPDDPRRAERDHPGVP